MTTVVFMGTPQFAVPILQGVIDHGYQVLVVVTQPDRLVGRKKVLQMSPVKQAALTNNIPVLQTEKISGSEEMQKIMMMQPDIIITAAYGQFLPTSLLNSAKIAAINVPNANKLIAVRKSLRVVNRLIKNAVTGIIIPFTSINADCNHCTVPSEIFKSLMIGGSAVPSKV